MILAQSRKFAAAADVEGQLRETMIPPEERTVSHIGAVGFKDPRENQPFRFDHLKNGLHHITFHDDEAERTLTLVFGRADGEKAPVAVLGQSIRDTLRHLNVSVQLSQSPGSGEEVAYGVYPSVTPDAHKAIRRFTGGEDNKSNVVEVIAALG